MKNYVLGFLFNKSQKTVLLIEKKRPKWQAGRWNGIGGKIEETDTTPLEAMKREAWEEIGHDVDWTHVLTVELFHLSVFVYKAVDIPEHEAIFFEQKEDELLKVWPIDALPDEVMSDVKWMIPICLSPLQFPLIVQQDTLGGFEIDNQSSTEKWTCPMCGHENSHENKVCMGAEMGDGRCGSPKPAEKWTCPKCNYKNSPEDKICKGHTDFSTIK